MRFFKTLYLQKRFFIILALFCASFMISFWVPLLFPITWVSLILFCVVLIVDGYLVYQIQKAIEAKRLVPQKLSNGEDNIIQIQIHNKYPFAIQVNIIDEVPIQFQKRDFKHIVSMESHSNYVFDYIVNPLDRGSYLFGNLNIYVNTSLQLITRRFVFQNHQTAVVYPSIIQMQRYDFLAISNRLTDFGLKKIRRIGHTQEFEQIKEYTVGDDFRTINWKATAKKGQMMVNQYQDEKSQSVYNIIDTGRVMKMPFKGLTLLDYAINTALAFSNIALKRNDKVGLFTFSKNSEVFLPAQQRKSHLTSILEGLYGINTQFTDSDFGLLYAHIKRKITQRSLLILYTNFEHISALKRQLPYLKAIAQKHVLVVVFFENTTLNQLVQQPAKDLQQVYHKTVAEKMCFEKKIMQKELQRHGIHTILTPPENLTIDTINAYLQIKAKGIL